MIIGTAVPKKIPNYQKNKILFKIIDGGKDSKEIPNYHKNKVLLKVIDGGKASKKTEKRR